VGQVQVVMEKATVIVVVQGEVDAASAHGIGEQLLASATGRAGTRCLVVDLRHVTFVDSCGLGMLLRLDQSLAHRGIEAFMVVKPSSFAARLFQITDLGRLVSVHHRMGDALEAARQCVASAAAVPATG
jgi:anti-anti-sigma factor